MMGTACQFHCCTGLLEGLPLTPGSNAACPTCNLLQSAARKASSLIPAAMVACIQASVPIGCELVCARAARCPTCSSSLP